MLSPASLRVCCLAVMAPALTKADRQADCLPVVLSESFCIAKTSDTYNITARISENRLKCVCSPDYSPNKRPFMHRACWRTQKSGSSILCKYRTGGNDLCKSLLYFNRVRTQKEAKYKTWPSTNTTTAYAGKIKLKYTMNKNTSNIRNMGLAKANTSLGLHKKLKRFSKENQSSGPINVMDDSLNFSDSADSPMHMAPLITDITNSDCDAPLVDNDSVPCVSNHGRISEDGILNMDLETAYENAVSNSVIENDSQPFLSVSADSIEVMDTSVTLTDLLSSTTKNAETSKNSQSSASALSCNVPRTCAINVSTVDTEVKQPRMSAEESQSPLGDSILEQSESSIEKEISLQPLISKQESNSIFINLKDINFLSLNSKYSNNSPVGSLFSTLKSSTLLTNSTRLSQICDKQVKCPVLRDCRFGSNYLIPVRQEKGPCCSPSNQELESLKSMLAEKSTNVSSVLSSSTRLFAKYLNAHIKKQIGSFVEHYQRKLQIPCQRPARHSSAKSYKHLQDAQAEILQNEAIKHLSTAELVKRLLQGKDKVATKSALLSNFPDVSDDTPLNFDPEDCEDIKHTSGVLISVLKNVLKRVDPYLTESSEEECESDSDDDDDDDETASECETKTTEPDNALWKYLMSRIKLGSRSTWLLSRIHELEFRIKEYSERLNELVKTEGNVCLDQPIVALDSISESAETGLQTAVMKNFFLPLNGFLDRNDASRIARDPFQSELDSIKYSESDAEAEICCRTRPLNTVAFRKRKLVVIPGLHNISPKFSRLSTVNCICNSQNDLAPCILCTGQYHSVQTVDPESMALRDRIAILDPYFHPTLSTEKDIPLCLHLENVLKTDAKYHNVRPPSPEPNIENYIQVGMKSKFSDLRSHQKLSRYARSLSAKYRNKHHRTTKHLRKHKLVFGKWRRLHPKHTLRARNRFRRQSIVSSGSSDSPVNSPMSVYDDGLGFDSRKRRDESQFDIDDVIIPCSSRSGRLVEIQYKEIMTPSWRNTENEILICDVTNDTDEEENITDSFLTKRHDMLVIEEKEKVKRSALGLNRRMRRNRCDSRADSSGANTPDPTSLYNNQDNVFQIPIFSASAGPASPVSRPATPNSTIASDDSQPPLSNGSTIRPEKKKLNPKRTIEESPNIRNIDFDDVPPYEPLQFPLTDVVYEELLAESDHNREVYDLPSNTSSFPASPISSSSSTSTVEDEDEDDEDDITDPEWTVVKPMRSYSEQALVLKFAKR